MANLKVGIVLSATDKATKPLQALSKSAGTTGKALTKMGDQAAAARQMDRLAGKVKASRHATAALGGELRELSGEARDAAAGTARLASWQERLARSTGQARAQVGRLGRALDARLSRSPRAPRRGGFLPGLAGGVLGGAIYHGVSRAAGSLGGFVGTAATFETLEATLGTIEGSSGKAKKSMDWISDFAVKTPFELDQVSDAFVKLRAYGMEPTGGLLRSLGDTASGMGKDVMQAVEAIADAVTGENERLKEFGIKARTKGDTITYEYTLNGETRTAIANARDRAEIQRVLTGIMDSKYAGAMEARMGTFSGMMSNLSDQWTRFQLKVMTSGPFEVLKDRLRGVLDRINAMAADGKLQKLADSVGQSFLTAFDTFEKDILPVLRDEIWPALKGIGSVVVEIVKGANSVAEAIGGWGNVTRGVAFLLGGKLLTAIGGAGVRGVGRSYKRARSVGGRIKKVVTSDTAKRMRGTGARLAGTAFGATKGGAAKLASSAFGMAKTGTGKAVGGIARFGRMLMSLALRFAPLLMGALKALGAVFAGLSLPVTAAVAAIAGAAYLIWKHWEPIKGFVSKLWESITTAFSSAWEKLSSIDWSGLGKRLLNTLVQGLRSAGGAVWDALKGVLGKLVDLLPGSDARTGPLSRLTASGSAILSTLGEGVRRTGADALQRPLARALGTAAAGLALTIPATPETLPVSASPTAAQRTPESPGRASFGVRLRKAVRPLPPARDAAGQATAVPTAPQISRTVHHHYRITIQQLPGENAEELARRVADELERRQSLAGREALGDAY